MLRISENHTHHTGGYFAFHTQNGKKATNVKNAKTHRFTNPSRGATNAQKQRIFQKNGHRCAQCGTTTGPFEVDHIDNTRNENYFKDTNLQILCETCHRAKTRLEAIQGHQKRKQRGQYPKERHPGLK